MPCRSACVRRAEHGVPVACPPPVTTAASSITLYTSVVAACYSILTLCVVPFTLLYCYRVFKHAC